jgi:tyrosyl-tRNA synthetase
MMRIAQRHGHKPIVLMGGATTKVGDPSGKDKSRPVLTHEDIQDNIQSIQKSFSKYHLCQMASSNVPKQLRSLCQLLLSFKVLIDIFRFNIKTFTKF